ncbi:MAG: helix-turn-helix domain-containing protein [Actinomycetes bacterium]
MSTEAHVVGLHEAQDAKLTPVGPRFLSLAEVAEVLGVSGSQVYALVRNQELKAIKIGGRGQWRVETKELEAYIQRMYDETQRFVEKHPFGRGDDDGST